MLRELLDVYDSEYAEELVYKHLMKQLLALEGDDAFLRSCQVGHFTASCWLLNSKLDHFLLMHHRKLSRWFQPGGHCDGERDVLKVAVKEAQEETGILEITPVLDSIFDLDIHYIPKRNHEHTHLHFDVRFLLKAAHEDIKPNNESTDMRWFSKDEDMFIEDFAMRRMYNKWCSLES